MRSERVGGIDAQQCAVRMKRIVASSGRLTKRRELARQRRVDAGWWKGRGQRWMVTIAVVADGVCDGGGSGE